MQRVLSDIMQESGVSFGTSGARGLVTALTDRVCYSYAAAYARYLLTSGERHPGEAIALAGDLRPSTPRILAACARAFVDNGLALDFQGYIPSPAIAWYGLLKAMPAVMVTGSHIPADRNGIKFTTARGEITKDEERALAAVSLELPEDIFADGQLKEPFELPRASTLAKVLYVRRYWDFFPKDCLKGYRLGVYEHSAVGRELMGEILEGLGATVVRGGYSATFVPVDTEALRPEDHDFALNFVKSANLQAVVSSDGDSDRPLVADENGHWLKGDIAGIITANYLKAENLVVPVSVSTVVDQCGYFPHVERSRIGSPFVIAAMEQLAAKGRTMGFEANGGFLLASEVEASGRKLAPLPTRDVPLVHICTLLAAKEAGVPLSALPARLPAWYTAAGRLKNFPHEISLKQLAALAAGSESEVIARLEGHFSPICGKLAHYNTIDGLRCTFANREVIHLRASGNAPEFRVYSEGATPERAQEIVEAAIKLPESWL